ncbi:MAG: sigma-70 family RNA polymerase sigma factor [Planctomycetota bacterium]
MSTDGELVRRARRGDQEALDGLIRRHLRPAFAIAYALTGSTDSSDDIVQRAMVSALSGLARLEHPDRFGAWLAAIVRRASLLHRREEARRNRLREKAGSQLTRDQLQEDPMEARERAHQLLEEVHELPEALRVPLLLYYFDEQSTSEVARRLRLKEATVRKRLQLARDRLRGRLGIAFATIAPSPGLAERILASVEAAGGASTAELLDESVATNASAKVGSLVSATGVITMKSKALIAVLLGLTLMAGTVWILGPGDTIEPISKSASPPSSGRKSELLSSAVLEDHREEPESATVDASASRRSVRGRILERHTRRPIEGAWLGLESPAHEDRWTRSTANGLFELRDIAAGRCTLFDPRFGQGTEIERSLQWEFDPTPTEVGTDHDAEIEVFADARFLVAGRVIRQGSLAPVAGLALALLQPGERTVDLGQTDDSGFFRSRRGRPAGEAAIVATGLARDLGQIEDHLLARIELGPEHDTIHLNLELDWTGQICGRVEDANGVAVSGAEVHILAASSAGLHVEAREVRGRRAKSDEEGQFRFVNLPVDRELALLAVATGYAPSISRPVLVSAESQEIVVTMLAGATVSGSILDPTGEPARGTFVRLTPFQHVPEPLGAITDNDGLFSFENLLPGDYWLAVREYRSESGNPGVHFEELKVPPSGIDQLRIRLQPAPIGKIEGVIVTENGTPFRDHLMVTARPLSSQAGALGAMAIDGRFEFEVLEPGRYRLEAANPSVLSEPLLVDTGTRDVRLVAVLPEAPANLLVRVLDTETEQPLTSADVLLEYDQASWLRPDWTDVFGELRWDGLAPRRYRVWARARGFVLQSQPVTLVSGETQSLTFRLSRGRAIDGRVVDRHGLPVSGVRVGLVLPTIGLRGDYELRSSIVTSDRDGRFTINGVGPGNPWVAVIRGRWHAGSLEVVQATDGTVELTVPW